MPLSRVVKYPCLPTPALSTREYAAPNTRPFEREDRLKRCGCKAIGALKEPEATAALILLLLLLGSEKLPPPLNNNDVAVGRCLVYAC